MRLVPVYCCCLAAFSARSAAASSSLSTESIVVPQQQFYITGEEDDHEHSLWYDDDDHHDSPITPRLRLEDMALALRWTGELNRRLQASTGISRRSVENDVMELPLNNHEQESLISYNENEPLVGQAADVLRGGQQQQREAYRVPSLLESYSREDSFEASDEPELTIFHAMTPRRPKPGSASPRRGAARWGPDLARYLQTLAEIFDIDNDHDDGDVESDSESNQILALAMMYLDRACSVEVPRSNGLAPCPFLTPRTAHRLVLCAFMVAVETVRGETEDETAAVSSYCSKVTAALGIPVEQLQQMVDWMRGALGDPGLFVAPYQVADFAQTWNLRFGSDHRTATAAADDATPRRLVPPRPAFVNR